MAADEQTLGIVWAETARLVPFDGSDTTRQRLQAVVGRLVDQARSLGSTANFARPAALPGIAPAPGGERAEAMRQAVSAGIATGKFNALDLPRRAVLWEVTATGEPREADARLPKWAEWIKQGPVARTFDFKVDGDSTGRVFRLYESDAEAGIDAVSFVSGFTQSGIPRLKQKSGGLSGPWLVGGLATILFFWMIITLGWTGRTVAQARDLMNGSPPEYATAVVKSVLRTCTDSSQPQQPAGTNDAQIIFVPACTGPGAPDAQARNEDGVAQAMRTCLVPPKSAPALLSISPFCRLAWRAAAERANSPEMTTLPWPFGGLLLAIAGWAAKPSGVTASISIVLPLIGFWLSIALLGAALGWGTRGSIFGIWINAQNRISLARMQVSIWTITVLGGYAALALFNIGELADSIREFYVKTGNGAEILPQAFPDIPAMILAALGISVASPMIASLIKTYSNGPSVDVQDRSMAADASGIGRFVDRSDGNLEVRPVAAQASLVDLFTGETENDKNQVDVARLQNVVITFILVSSYAVLLFGFARDIAPTTIVRALDMGAALFPSLPDPGGTFTTLLAASHATYLVSKRAALQA